MIDVVAGSDERPLHLQGLADRQVALYHRMLAEVSAGRGDYWTCLDGLDALDADKYEVANALGATTEARKYAARAGIEITRRFDTHLGTLTTTEVEMGALNVGDRFVGHDERTVYEVTDDCASHERGWLFVRKVGAEHVWNEREQVWSDEGFFDDPQHALMNRVVS